MTQSQVECHVRLQLKEEKKNTLVSTSTNYSLKKALILLKRGNRLGCLCITLMIQLLMITPIRVGLRRRQMRTAISVDSQAKHFATMKEDTNMSQLMSLPISIKLMSFQFCGKKIRNMTRPKGYIYALIQKIRADM